MNPTCVKGYEFCSPSIPCRDCEHAELKTLRNDHYALKMSVESICKHGEKLQRELSNALLQNNELRAALDRWLHNYDMNACTRQDINEAICKDSRKLIEKRNDVADAVRRFSGVCKAHNVADCFTCG